MYINYEVVDFSELVGKVFQKVYISKIDDGNDCLCFVSDNEVYAQFHLQKCCEDVSIEDIDGDLNYLIKTPILKAFEDSSKEIYNDNEGKRSETWTFYKIATEKGWVDIRWYGTSNGYYSERAELCKIPREIFMSNNGPVVHLRED